MGTLKHWHIKLEFITNVAVITAEGFSLLAPSCLFQMPHLHRLIEIANLMKLYRFMIRVI